MMRRTCAMMLVVMFVVMFVMPVVLVMQFVAVYRLDDEAGRQRRTFLMAGFGTGFFLVVALFSKEFEDGRT